MYYSDNAAIVPQREQSVSNPTVLFLREQDLNCLSVSPCCRSYCRSHTYLRRTRHSWGLGFLSSRSPPHSPYCPSAWVELWVACESARVQVSVLLLRPFPVLVSDAPGELWVFRRAQALVQRRFPRVLLLAELLLFLSLTLAWFGLPF